MNLAGLADNPDTISIDLPDRTALLARRVRFNPVAGFAANGHRNPSVKPEGLGYFWYGLSQDGSAEVTLTVVRGVMSGVVYGPNYRYSIATSASGAQIFRLLDPDALDFNDSEVDGAGASGQSNATTASPQQSATVASNFPITIKVMVLYTPSAFTNGAKTQGAMDAQIAAGVDQLNMALANSQLRVNYVLAHSAQIAYDETAVKNAYPNDWNTRFDQYRRWLRSDPTVASLRDTYKADEVEMLVYDSKGGGISYTQRPNCGAFFPPNIDGCLVGQGYKAFAFSVIDYSHVTQDYTFAHEVGHTLGCDHDPSPNDGGAAAGQNAYYGSYGHWVDHVARDVMSYYSNCTGGSPDFCPKKLIFSNPDVNFPGTSTPSGRLQVEDPPPPPTDLRYRDNASTITYLAQGVANFYEPTVADDTIFIDGFE